MGDVKKRALPGLMVAIYIRFNNKCYLLRTVRLPEVLAKGTVKTKGLRFSGMPEIVANPPMPGINSF